MDKNEARKQFEHALRGIEAEYQDKVRSHNQWRDQEIESARKFWVPLLEGGETEESFASLNNGIAQETPANRISTQKSSQQVQAKPNGAGGRTIPTEVIKRYVGEVIHDPNVEIVTQTEIKDRLLREFPDAKLPSVRSGIANELYALRQTGHLELVEKGRAGQPNKYRETGKPMEANLLET